MITVRFPNGQAVKYNNAITLQHEDTFRRITDKQGGLIAIVPLDCICEWEPACCAYNPITYQTNEKLEELAKEIRSLMRKVKNGKG
jgi:hypothetical protein